MNNKRQKIWLISMLGLMVVLSAYYLFTDHVDEMDVFTNDLSGLEVNVSESGADSLDELLGDNVEETVLSDDEIIEQYEAQEKLASTDKFIALGTERQELLNEKYSAILDKIVENESRETMDEAYNELHALEQQHTMVTNLEEMLAKDYGNVLITQEENKWKVLVQADVMEKSQAVSVIDMVSGQLNIQPNEVVVQYIN